MQYPSVVISEIDNATNSRYNNSSGETVSDLAYMIEFFCEVSSTTDGKTLSALESTKLLGNKIDALLSGTSYKLRRVNKAPIRPIDLDNNVFRGVITYDCSFDIVHNIIYNK